MKFDLHSYRFGVNYTPSRNWWYCWNDFHADSIARDFDMVARLGADHLRIMLIWPFFQPNRSWVSPAHLERLDVLMGLARERNLDVCPSMLTGWLSGYPFKAFFERKDSFFSSERAWAAQQLYFRSVAEVVGGHDNFLGFDLGNEIDCCWKTDNLEEGDAWHNRMMELCHELFPKHVHTNGLDHQPWFFPQTFSPGNTARNQTIVALHPYSHFSGALKQTNGDVFAPASIRLLAATAALARSYANSPTKPVWIQEYGMCEAWTEKKSIAPFLEKVTLNGIAGGATWFTWWCSHDLDPKFEFQELEYSLGLLTQDQKIKPQGEAFRRLAEAYRGRRLDKAALARLPFKSPPTQHDNEGTWKWLHEWLHEAVAVKTPAVALEKSAL